MYCRIKTFANVVRENLNSSMLPVVANKISHLSSILRKTDTSGQPSKSRNESGVPAFDQDGPSTSYIYPYSRHGGEDNKKAANTKARNVANCFWVTLFTLSLRRN
ncbi:hypothetical protein TNIN_42641 [Trichonephila inaurata madagascariensis]|uniref:Uncharacterized protein n=1 Tax=Trichonephila inaurata madagascariensis TaxID=2747483 RepID=A0A8X6MFC8_9ARAC|nr:hypothetical protein TNIN_42641 [Trichonephila inaurata madagascariensis]